MADEGNIYCFKITENASWSVSGSTLFNMNKFLICSLIVFGCFKACLAQDIIFKTLSTETGLSHNSVTTIYQDGQGLIWIGTREGLNRYNGFRVQRFLQEEKSSNDLTGGAVKTITGDGIKKVYILNNAGVLAYDSKSDKFRFIVKGHFQQIKFIQGALFILNDKNIYRYNAQKAKNELFFSLSDAALSIKQMHIDSSERLWIGTEKDGLFFKDSDGKLKKVIDGINVTQIYEDKKGQLWVGSWENGIFKIKDEQLINFRHHLSDPYSLSSDFVRDFTVDDYGSLWIGTFRGLDKLDEQTGRFAHYRDNGRIGSLSNSSVWSVIKDRQGTIWVGTYFGGVNYFQPDYEIYTYYRKSEIEGKGLSSSVIGKMTEDIEGNLWICTEGGGLNQYNRQTGEITWFRHNPKANSISQDNLKAIYYDRLRNVLWVGTHMGGLNKLELISGKFTHYLNNKDLSGSIPSNIVREIIPYGNKLILATGKGVGIFDPVSGNYTNLVDIEGYTLLIDSKGVLWISGIGSGVLAYRFDTGKFKRYKHDPQNTRSLSGNLVSRIIEDGNGRLWFGTDTKGLNLFEPNTDNFKRIDLGAYGISSNSIYDIKESASGNLVITSNQSLVIFNTRKFSFKDYRFERGFPLGAINESSLYIAKDNRIYLGGVTGMVSFLEADLWDTPKPYSIILEDLWVNNQLVKAGDRMKILQEGLSFTKEITLESEHTVFSIEWATNNYIAANKDDIIYRLEGFSDTWSPLREQTPITFSNLSAGHYNLVLKANRANGPTTQLSIRVLPPIYRTMSAYLLYVVICGTGMYYILKANRSRIRLQESLRYEQRHLKDIESLNQSKLQFFTNISHEFRTPLTLIIGQVEELIREKSLLPSNLQKNVNGIYRSSTQLRELISELLDFRKNEEGGLRIKVKKGDIVAFLSDCFRLFEVYAVSRDIDFKLQLDRQELICLFDSRQMQKVINNLLSNAFNNTRSGANITLSLLTRDNSMEIQVADTGAGILPEELKNIFELFYQSDNLKSSRYGTGIGLSLAKSIVELHHGTMSVESRPGEETTFTVALPLGDGHFPNTEFINTDIQDLDTYIDRRSLLFDENFQVEVFSIPEMEVENRKKMLIVEDNPALRDMLVGIFSKLYEVEWAADGVEGLEKARELLPDIIISDVLMPHLSGTELCRRLKSEYATCHIPVVLLTARASLEHKLEGFLTGADDYVPKPFQTQILIARCNNLVNNRLLLQEKFSKQPGTSVQVLATNQLDNEFLTRATRLIEENLSNPDFDITHFSREMGIARTNLFIKLKAVTGQTPNEFIATTRLKKGAYLLQTDPVISISEIAEQIGFNSQKYFSKCFREVYQINPHVYRRQFFDVKYQEK